jgi:hypothetical protein
MKKNSFKIFLLILFVGFGFGACQNFLIPDLDNQYTKTRFNSDPAWALGLLLQAYNGTTALPNSYQLDEVATDDAVTNVPTNTYLRMATGEWSSLFDPSNVWAGSYAAILNLNYFLSLVDQVQWSWQDTNRNRIFIKRYKGEAYGFRGYYYYKMLERMGGYGPDGTKLGVPIVNTPITSTDNWMVQRSSYDTTFMQAAADLDKGIFLMPYKYADIPGATTQNDVNWNRVNGAGINYNLIDGRCLRAYKAKLYLNAASPYFNNGSYDNSKLDSVISLLGNLITKNGGLASLGPDPIFWDADADVTPPPGNADILWRASYATNNTLESQNYPPSLYGSGRINPTQNLVDAFPMKNGYPITDAVNSGYNAQTPYAGRDPRLNMCILYNGGTERITGSTGSANIINTQSDNTTTSDGLNVLPLYSTRTGYYLKKLLRVAVNMNPSSTTTAIHYYARLRWTDLFLNYAEAVNERFGPDADGGFAMTPRQILQKIRARGAGAAGGGITQPDNYLISLTNAAAMRDMIKTERRIELCFEGWRFWDLRRWNTALATLNTPAKGVGITGTPAVYNYAATGVNPVENRAFQPFMYHGPIPYLETKKYPGFIQNAGW